MNIKELRKEKNLTQTELGNMFNLTRNQIARFENNETPVTNEVLVQLADYFDVSLDYLCGRQWNNNVGYIPEDRKEFVKQILELDDKDIEKAKAYVTALNDSKKG